MQQPDDNVLAAAPATEVEQLAPEYREAFRQAVQDVLRRVFDVDDAEASERVSAYFVDGGELSLSTYHRSPLQIATDLSPAADRELSSKETSRYLDVAKGPRDNYGLPQRQPPDESWELPMRTAW